MKLKRIPIKTAALAVGCSALLGCDRKQVVGHHHSIEMTVTGVGQSWTNADGMVWTELRFDQKPDKVTLNVDRAESVKVCERAGFRILLDMYRKMGRFDCFFCPNQRIAQAEKVMVHYPAQWQEWKSIEKHKGHAILSISAEAIEQRALQSDFIEALDRKPQCACFGGKDAWDDDDAPVLHNDEDQARRAKK